MIKTKTLTITNHINNNYRSYALYTLSSRGIPNFYDALTNVQRIILMNTPLKHTKTMSVVGNCFSAGYRHGDMSCSSAISKLAKIHGNAFSILNGDGFFGNSINSDAASPRYTSVSLNKDIHEIILKYKYLNSKSEDGDYKALHVDFPIGLLTTIVGIAVGYKTTILPRKMQDIITYLNGKKKSVQPFFIGYTGTVKQFEDLKNAWLFEGEYTVCENKITITSLPPLMSYKSFIAKLAKIISAYDISIENKTSDTVNIAITFKDTIGYEACIEKIIKLTKQIVRESMVFIKDSAVLEYSNLEDYLDDYRNYKHTIDLKNYEWMVNFCKKEIEYLKAKQEYFKFMKSKKDIEYIEIDAFIKQYPIEITERLVKILLKSLNKTEDIDIIKEIENYKLEVSKYYKLIAEKQDIIDNLDFTLKVKRTPNKLIENELLEINDIEVLQIKEEDLENGNNIED